MKWYGKIGFEETVEEVPGVYVEKICAQGLEMKGRVSKPLPCTLLGF